MAKKYSKSDPISDRYYRPLELAEICSDCLFWIVAFLSLLALALERSVQPMLYDFVQGGFVISVLVLFFLSQMVRLYWTPRAENKRRQDLLSYSFSVEITHEQTSGYYNNDETRHFKKLCVALLENSFFSSRITLKMAHFERLKIVFYSTVWILALLNRSSDLALSAVLAQALFSEQIVAKWMRIEWLRMRFEYTYDSLYRLIQLTKKFDNVDFIVRVIEAFVEYESSKGHGNTILSQKVFDQLNPSLSEEWKQIKASLKI